MDLTGDPFGEFVEEFNSLGDLVGGKMIGAECPQFFGRGWGSRLQRNVGPDDLAQFRMRCADHAVGTSSDERVCEETVRYLQSENPIITFLQLDDVDAAGHKHRYAPDVPGYLSAITENDRIIGEIWEAIRNRPCYAEESWLLIVSTDHGGTEYGHGQNIPEHRTIFVVAYYSDGTRITFPQEVNIVDIPMLVAKHLGIEIEPTWGWDGNLEIV